MWNFPIWRVPPVLRGAFHSPSAVLHFEGGFVLVTCLLGLGESLVGVGQREDGQREGQTFMKLMKTAVFGEFPVTAGRHRLARLKIGKCPSRALKLGRGALLMCLLMYEFFRAEPPTVAEMPEASKGP